MILGVGCRGREIYHVFLDPVRGRHLEEVQRYLSVTVRGYLNGHI